MKPGIYYNISNEYYHYNPKYRALSKGGIVQLLKSPAHFKAWEKRDKEDPTPAMNFGSAAHSLILEPNKNKVVKAPNINRRTTEGKELWGKFVSDSQDKIVITSDEWAQIKAMKKVINKSETASNLLRDGKPEATIYWRDRNYKYLCKARPDYVIEDLKILVDYKTAIDASPDAFASAIVRFGYDIQAAWYLYGMNIITNEIDEWKFIFIVQEKTPPFPVACYRAGDEILRLGEDKFKSAVLQYHLCKKVLKRWDAYPDELVDIIPPRWATY